MCMRVLFEGGNYFNQQRLPCGFYLGADTNWRAGTNRGNTVLWKHSEADKCFSNATVLECMFQFTRQWHWQCFIDNNYDHKPLQYRVYKIIIMIWEKKVMSKCIIMYQYIQVFSWIVLLETLHWCWNLYAIKSSTNELDISYGGRVCCVDLIMYLINRR